MKGTKFKLSNRFLPIALLGSLTIPLLFNRVASAVTSDDITARVDIAVCGDHHAEGNEDCDRNDFNGARCSDYGYAEGDLNCTISCEFDFSGCILPSPTPTPIPTLTPSATPVSTTSTENTSSTNNTNNSNSISEDKDKKEKKQSNSILEILVPNIPNRLRPFDTNEDDKITSSEIQTSVENWVENWNEAKTNVIFDTNIKKPVLTKSHSCDINNDGICNLVDFSILLYYIGR